MITRPRAIGKTAFQMRSQLGAIYVELQKNPDCKIKVASANEDYFKRLIQYAKSICFELELSIPESIGENFWWSSVVSIKRGDKI